MLPPSPGYHEGFVLKSKRPYWNPEHAVYELDFGGRINRDSVKNFQLDHDGEVVSVMGFHLTTSTVAVLVCLHMPM